MAEKQATTPPEPQVTKAPEPQVNLGIHDVTRIPVYPDTPPKESPLPEARAEIGQTAFERNLPHNRKPPAKPHRYRVTCEGKTGVYTATSESDAWALHCDASKSWPSRKIVRPVIEDLGVEGDA